MTEDTGKLKTRPPRGQPAVDPDSGVDAWAARQLGPPGQPYPRRRRRKFTSSIDHLRNIIVED